MTIPTTSLGRSGLVVSKLGLGTAPFGQFRDGGQDAHLVNTVHAALERGVTLFDTAPLYGAGYAEKVLGAALREVPRERYVLSTKVGRLVGDDGKVWFDFSRDGVLRSLEASLQRLGLDRVDIALIHDPDNHEQQAFHEAFPALVELRSQGVIGAIGAGMNQWQMEQRFVEQLDPDVFLLAGRYTLLEQTSLGFLELCRSRNIAVMLGGTYNSGILATGSQGAGTYNYAPPPPEISERVRRIEAVCARYGVPLHVAALRFAAAHPAVTAPVLGAVSPGEVAANVAALMTDVPPELWDDLRAEGLIDAATPVPV
ncbi:MAG TPA: aldo/keto reductase [Roseiflexaceae bacterium]|nr:aldo/keto reductase [Roseiflexaceae bacterium]